MKNKMCNFGIIVTLTSGLIACNGSGGSSSPSQSQTDNGITSALFCPYTTTPTYLNESVSSSASSYVPIAGGVTSYGSELCASYQRTISGNGIPNHVIGTFPNLNDPNPITQQTISFIATLNPSESVGITYLTRTPPGYLNNGVKLDPGTNETVCNNGTAIQAPTCPWNVEAIQPSIGNPNTNLGLDECNGHTQPGGWYHYHGLPTCYISTISSTAATSITLVGWAIDGFPIYNNYGYSSPTSSSSTIRKMRPSWQLINISNISATRSNLIESYPLGSFTQDYVYEAGSGDLDECNGRFAVTPDFPQGIYQYYTTESFPYIQRCIHGVE